MHFNLFFYYNISLPHFFRFNFEEGLPAQNFDTFVKSLLTVFQVSKFLTIYYLLPYVLLSLDSGSGSDFSIFKIM